MINKLLSVIFVFILSIGLSQAPPEYVMGTNTLENTCQALVFDSGGTAGGGPYSNNENQTITICPDNPGDFISLVWTIFALDPTNTNTAPTPSNADNITIYNAATADPAFTLGTYTAGALTAGDVFGANLALNPAGGGCLTIVFESNTIGVGDYAFTVSCLTPCDPPTADGMIVNADNAAGDSIAVCVNEVVTFQDNGSTAGPSGLFNIVEWIWIWGDGTVNDTLLAGTPITHSFPLSGEYIVQLMVIDDNGCANTNATDIRVYVTTYPTFDPFPNDTVLCVGEVLTLNAFPDQYEVQWTGFPLNIIDDDNCMEDLTGVVQPTPISITGFDPTITLTNATPDITSICVTMEHSYIGDFVLQVQCPTGQIMTLHQQGGGGTNLGDPDQGVIDCADPNTFGTPWTYCFDASATETWVQAVANGNTVPNATGGTSIPAGNYLPVDPLGFAALDGCPINGTWNMLFTDLWGADDGSLPGWQINFDSTLYPPVTNFTPDIGSASDSSYWDLTDPYITSNSADLNTITINTSTAVGGVYYYDYHVENSFGCAFDSTVSVTVEENMFIGAGPDTTICGGIPVNIGPGSGGGGATCDYTLILADSWADGWNGNTVDITTNAGTTNYPGPPTDTIAITIPVINGEIITIQFNNAGGGAGECSIFLYAGDGSLVYSDGTGFGSPTPLPQNVVVDCFLGYVFEWTPNNGTVTLPSDVNPSVNPLTPTVYTMTTYPIGHPDCATTDDVIVDIGVLIDPGNDSVATFCIDGIQEDLFNYLAGTPMNTGVWFDPNGVSITMPIDPSITPVGLYEYRIDSSGCSLSAFIDVTIINLIITPVLTNASCHTICDGVVEINTPGAFSYSIDNGVTFQNNINLFPGLCDDDYTIVVASDVNGGGCLMDSLVTITEPTALVLNPIIASDTIVCINDLTNLTALGTGGNGNYTYTWSNAIGVGPDVNYSPLETGNVCVTLTEDCPSPSVDACIYIQIPADILITIPNFTDACYPHEVDLINGSQSDPTAVNSVNPTSVIASSIWTFSDGINSAFNIDENVVHTFTDPGIYNVTLNVVSEYGCSYTQTFPSAIEAYDHPIANFNYSPAPLNIFNTNALFKDFSSGNIDNWEWTFTGGASPSFSNESSPSVHYPEGIPGIFPMNLKVTDNHGCVDSLDGKVEIINDVSIYAPNIFTPDVDDHNSTWKIYMSGIDVYDFHIMIYNRWGELVFESYDQNFEWDGSYGGQNSVQDGTYVWVIDTKDILYDNRYEFRGSISILK